MLAIERVWREKRELLHSVARSVAGDDSAAEDLLQEAIARVLESNRELSDPDSAFRYICRVLTNIAIDDYRRRQTLRRARGSLLCIAKTRAAVSASVGGPFRLMTWEERGLRDSVMEEVERAVKELPEKQREALDVMFSDGRGMTLQEFCRERGVPYSTLRSRMLKAVDVIRGRLRRKGLLAKTGEGTPA